MPDILVGWFLEANGSGKGGPCPICLPWGGRTAFLSEFAANPGLPPLHWNCYCDVLPVTSEDNAKDVQDAVEAQNDWLDSQGFNDIPRGETATEKLDFVRRRTDLLRQAADKMRNGDFG